MTLGQESAEVAAMPAPEASRTLAPRVRLLLWDYERGSQAYDIAFLVAVLIVLLVPGGFWGDPLW